MDSTPPIPYFSAQSTFMSISCISLMSNGTQQEFLTGPETEGWSIPPIDAFAKAWWINPSPQSVLDDCWSYDPRCPAIPTQPTDFLGSLYITGGLNPPATGPSASQALTSPGGSWSLEPHPRPSPREAQHHQAVSICHICSMAP